MTNVVAGKNEGFESLIRRFNKKVQTDGVLSDVSRREYYEKPSTKRKRKTEKKRS